MTKGGFDKIERSDALLYGPPKLILCGFPVSAQATFKSLLEMLGLADLPLVWAGSGNGETVLSALLALEGSSGEGQPSDLPRAVIVSGIRQTQLHRLMNGCRQAGMQPALWAVLTPTSEQWTLSALLAELERERQAMARRRKQQN